MNRSTLIALYASVALTAPALAQDAFPWTGFYAGINAGYGSGNGTGFVGGGQAGYDLVLPSAWLVGIETDLQGTTLGPALHVSGPFATGSYSLDYSSSLNFLGTTRVRLGYVLPQNILVYATGGLAYGNVNATTSFSVQQSSGVTNIVLHRSNIDTGWTVGAGAEYPIADHLKLRAEYLYTDLGSYSVERSLAGSIGGSASMSASTTTHIGRFALSYALN